MALFFVYRLVKDSSVSLLRSKRMNFFQFALIFHDNIVSFAGHILKNDLISEKPLFP